jgi:uncharacterized protein (DUF488 family)
MFSLGHSTRTMEDFVALLRAHGVRRVVDARSVPRSRRNPQFDRAALARALHNARIHYTHLAALGGLRRTRPGSVNLGWRNASFRGFADYMQTPEFARGLERLIALAHRERSAIMCAEAALALPSLADCRRPPGPRHHGAAHRQPHASGTASSHAFRVPRRRQDHLSG